ncbi:hypothetical protein K0M31_010228 [Melipona bicolor]|uniref:Uncharacterized protein n=1 Tax=Melipona bicolor TaxID=60889 RepID=A0AA40FLQ6_9HYME|nr:hypothetical protein K0M31_010228 [Melipona bicolor]
MLHRGHASPEPPARDRGKTIVNLVAKRPPDQMPHDHVRRRRGIWCEAQCSTLIFTGGLGLGNFSVSLVDCTSVKKPRVLGDI